jgi:hypothetical protein
MSAAASSTTCTFSAGAKVSALLGGAVIAAYAAGR